MGDAKKIQWTRTKVHEHAHLEAGKGLPESVSKSLKKHQKQKVSRRSLNVDLQLQDPSKHPRTSITGRRSLQLRSVITKISALLDLEEYEFPEEPDAGDPSKVDAQLDVTALDRYNEDIRRIRKQTIDECRMLPQKGEAEEYALVKVKLIVRSLCRTAHYGTHKAQVLAEGAVILIVWLLNRRNFPATFKIHILQSFAEMLWISVDLKKAVRLFTQHIKETFFLNLYKCTGMKVLAKLMVGGLNRRSEQARWACYTLAMSCVGSPSIIDVIARIPFFDEAVGEIAFDAYWINWPANFGSILQGILYGPHSVVTVEDVCDFV